MTPDKKPKIPEEPEKETEVDKLCQQFDREREEMMQVQAMGVLLYGRKRYEKGVKDGIEQGKLEGINAFREKLMKDIQDNPTDETVWRDGCTTFWDWIEIIAEELGAEHLDYTNWLKSQLSKKEEKEPEMEHDAYEQAEGTQNL